MQTPYLMSWHDRDGKQQRTITDPAQIPALLHALHAQLPPTMVSISAGSTHRRTPDEPRLRLDLAVDLACQLIENEDATSVVASH